VKRSIFCNITLCSLWKATWYYIPEDGTLHNHCCKNLKCFTLYSTWSRSQSHITTDGRPVRLGVLPLLEQVTRCYIYLSDNYFLYFSCRAPSLMRGQVCNLQCNDASSISSYIATYGLSASLSWCRVGPITIFQFLCLTVTSSSRCRAPSPISTMNRAIQPKVKVTLVQGEIVNAIIRKAAWEACSATWNLGTNSAFALGPRKTTENLVQIGRSQDLPNADWLLASSPVLNPWTLTLVPNLCCCVFLFCFFFFPPFFFFSTSYFFYNYLYVHMIWISTKLYKTHVEGRNAYVNKYSYKYAYICICVFLRLLLN
jgi:hypothetical protein